MGIFRKRCVMSKKGDGVCARDITNAGIVGGNWANASVGQVPVAPAGARGAGAAGAAGAPAEAVEVAVVIAKEFEVDGFLQALQSRRVAVDASEDGGVRTATIDGDAKLVKLTIFPLPQGAMGKEGIRSLRRQLRRFNPD